MRPVVSSRAVLQWCEARSRAPAFVDHRPVIVADRHLTAQGKRYAGRNILRKGVFWYPTHPACWVIQYPVPNPLKAFWPSFATANLRGIPRQLRWKRLNSDVRYLDKLVGRD